MTHTSGYIRQLKCNTHTLIDEEEMLVCLEWCAGSPLCTQVSVVYFRRRGSNGDDGIGHVMVMVGGHRACDGDGGRA